MIARYISALAVSAGVTFGLFFIMQVLVGSGDTTLTKDDSARILDMVQVERKIEPQRKERKVERPQEVEAPPPDLDIPITNTNRPGATSVAFNNASIDSSADMAGDAFAGIGDGEMLPIVRVEPTYPRRAQERGVEGSVTLRFTVTAIGTVDNIEVLEAEPPGYFERAAERAVSKWKYKPKVVNGEGVPVPGVMTILTFKFGEE